MAPKPQGQGEMTFQADVGPGDVTGVYYITICNLPFETSWQQLKDWLRPHCEVDHIEVFKTSTSGWVRLRGKRNFDKAWRCLDGGVFHGRSIIASDRNRSEAIKIKELLDFGSSSSRERQRSDNGLLTQPGSPTLYGSPAVANKPGQNSERLHAQCCTGGVAQACVPMVPTAIVDYTTVPQYVMPSADPTAFARTQAAAAALRPAFQIQYRCNNVANLPIAAQTSSLQRVLAAATEGESSTSASVHEGSLDRCKILLKNLPHRSVAKDIDIWTRRRLGGFEKGLNGVDVPIDDSGVYTRGHAVLRLNSLVDPGWVVKKLHQHTFRGRTVSASKLTDEAAYAKGKYTTSSGDQRGGCDDSSDTSSGSGPSRPRSNGPLVVEGSSHKATGRRH